MNVGHEATQSISEYGNRDQPDEVKVFTGPTNDQLAIGISFFGSRMSPDPPTPEAREKIVELLK
ncbi:MAG: hypothetical protein UW42_C0013G0015 [Candidatus Collierbacteria bacterium GW2011_GWB1_44_197]|nr:MAG: hypothetical protein UW42_C0013G0015 [Candidatus Collierbacteria bacterium GW2011_GWB1_44_197]